jgi:hypothetical protein
MLVKTFIHPTAVKYLEETVDEFHINPYSGIKQPQYYVTLTNGAKYLLDVYEPNNELVAVYSMESLDEGFLDTMADELDTMGEYVELCAQIERHLLKLAKLHKIVQTEYKKLDTSLGCQPQVNADNLLSFINKLNNDYVKNFLK